jgi:hypothetical protein
MESDMNQKRGRVENMYRNSVNSGYNLLLISGRLATQDHDISLSHQLVNLGSHLPNAQQRVFWPSAGLICVVEIGTVPGDLADI